MRRRFLLASGAYIGATGALGCNSLAYGEWLAGGTAAKEGEYPDPFDGESPAACTFAVAQACGPCHFPGPNRKDVTAGEPGLPMRLSLRFVVSSTCEPLVDAEVELWYVDTDGVYSGETPRDSCQRGDEGARSLDFHRGRLITDQAGRVDFDAVFPGWYPGRTTHLHLWIATADGGHFVTQLYVPDDLAEEIYRSHPDYDHRKRRGVDNDHDELFDSAVSNMLSIDKTLDLAMLAYATLAIAATPGGTC